MISVCIATFNGGDFLKEELESILPQLSNNDEVVISDDHSSDNTREIIEGFRDPRIKFLKNENSKGCASNFENALNNSKGDIIFLADQDDIWESDKVAVSMKYMEKYDFIFSDATMINERGEIILDSYFKKRQTPRTILGNIIKFSGLGCCMCFKRNILGKALPFPPNSLLYTHDNWLFLVAAFYFKAFIAPEKLIRYRRHGKTVSTGGDKSHNSVFFMFHYRVYEYWFALKRAFL